jgi:hypothetical protein
VGYFNMRGWKHLDRSIERWVGGAGSCCRLLVGMQRLPVEDLRVALGLAHGVEEVNYQTALRKKSDLADQFREQPTLGALKNEPAPL